MRMEVKDRILQKTEEMFLKYGFRKVRTDEIAREIGISKRTLYEQFSSKEELITEMLSMRFNNFHEQMDRKVAEIQASDDKSYLKLIKEMGEIAANYFSYFNSQLLEDISRYLPKFANRCKVSESEKFGALNVLHEYGLKHNKIRKEINFSVFLMSMRFIMDNILKPEVLRELSLTTNEVIDQVHTIMMLGLLTEDATNEIKQL